MEIYSEKEWNLPSTDDEEIYWWKLKFKSSKERLILTEALILFYGNAHERYFNNFKIICAVFHPVTPHIMDNDEHVVWLY